MVFTNKDRYEGEFQNGQKHGRGVYFHVDGSKYEGEWNLDDKNGVGAMSYANGDL